MAGDNGSPVCGWGAAGSNAPLRGSKASNWCVLFFQLETVATTWVVDTVAEDGALMTMAAR